MKRLILWVMAGLSLFLSLRGADAAETGALDPRDSDNPYGVLAFLHWDHDWNDHHFKPADIEKAADLMQEAGIGWVRVDFLWDDIEPSRGEWKWDKYDHMVETLRSRGIRILGILNYNTGWASSKWNDAPTPELYVEYARQVVARYKDRVRYWEIWNEPDSKIYWEPQDDMRSYTALLTAVYPVIKQEDPTSRVVLGGLSQGLPFPLKRVYQHGGEGSFDVVNIHPFADPLLAESKTFYRGLYRSVKKTMEKYGDGDKEIWFTEVGCPGVPADKLSRGWWMGVSPDESAQAKWLEHIFTESFKWPGVKRVFWAFLRDTPDHFKNDIDHFGILREDFSKKPAFDALKRLAAERAASTGKDPS